MTPIIHNDEAGLDLVIVHFEDRIVQGLADRAQWRAYADLSSRAGSQISFLTVRRADTDLVEHLPVDGMKAVYFVRDFTGTEREELRFHDHLPPPQCLWVRITFHDGEVIEGILRNSCDHVLTDGFFLAPNDPGGNNWLVYVRKAKLRDFHVLGLRAAPRSLAKLRAFLPTPAEAVPHTT